ncbi:hypothetical protein HZS_4564 [Henneguya salminicola]|nr:hypothetical protein HZS_4564 [Henneguya salminicola]
MAEPKLYNLINNSLLFRSFLLEHNLIFDPETISQLNLTCGIANCRNQIKASNHQQESEILLREMWRDF